MFSYNDDPNPAPLQEVDPAKTLVKPEVTFQLSFKARLWRDIFGKDICLWAALYAEVLLAALQLRRQLALPRDELRTRGPPHLRDAHQAARVRCAVRPARRQPPVERPVRAPVAELEPDRGQRRHRARPALGPRQGLVSHPGRRRRQSRPDPLRRQRRGLGLLFPEKAPARRHAPRQPQFPREPRRRPGRVELPDVRHDRRIRTVFPGLRREPARLRPQDPPDRDRVHPLGLVLTAGRLNRAANTGSGGSPPRACRAAYSRYRPRRPRPGRATIATSRCRAANPDRSRNSTPPRRSSPGRPDPRLPAAANPRGSGRRRRRSGSRSRSGSEVCPTSRRAPGAWPGTEPSRP
ncbi:MAG: phospholipase A [Ignavibacteriales bacterium]|nr:phospholipase A [Ignavibacteriales bacterium]